MERQPHPDAIKAQAKTVYQAHGAKRAAELTHVAIRTVRYWARREGWRQPATATGKPPDLRVATVADANPAQPKGSVAGFAGYQPARLLERVTAELWAQLDTLAKLREAGRARDSRETAVVVGILIQRAAELAKQAGMDRGQLDPAVALARLDALMDSIEQGAAGA
jgi:hypothetical protein